MRDYAEDAMNAISQILRGATGDANPPVPATVPILNGVIDLNDYQGQRLPAIGVEWVEVTNDGAGAEKVYGFCEVVCMGDRKTALEKCRELAAKVYGKLRRYNVKEAHVSARFNGVKATGYRKLSGETNGTFVAVVHVLWEVDV